MYTKSASTALEALGYNYPPAGGRLNRVYTADGSSVPAVAPPPSTGSTYTGGPGTVGGGPGTIGGGPGTIGGTSPPTGTQYGQANQPQCSRRNMLARKRRDLDNNTRRSLEGDAFFAKRNRHARRHHH